MRDCGPNEWRGKPLRVYRKYSHFSSTSITSWYTPRISHNLLSRALICRSVLLVRTLPHVSLWAVNTFRRVPCICAMPCVQICTPIWAHHMRLTFEVDQVCRLMRRCFVPANDDRCSDVILFFRYFVCFHPFFLNIWTPSCKNVLRKWVMYGRSAQNTWYKLGEKNAPSEDAGAEIWGDLEKVWSAIEGGLRMHFTWD